MFGLNLRVAKIFDFHACWLPRFDLDCCLILKFYGNFVHTEAPFHVNIFETVLNYCFHDLSVNYERQSHTGENDEKLSSKG